MDFKEAEEALDLMPLNQKEPVLQKTNKNDIAEDKDLRYLLNVGMEAIEELVDIARNSENTKAYDSLSKMIKVVGDIKFRMKETSVQNNNKIVNNSVFISTTKNIIDSISKEIDKIYDLTKEEIELIEDSNKPPIDLLEEEDDE